MDAFLLGHGVCMYQQTMTPGIPDHNFGIKKNSISKKWCVRFKHVYYFIGLSNSLQV